MSELLEVAIIIAVVAIVAVAIMIYDVYTTHKDNLALRSKLDRKRLATMMHNMEHKLPVNDDKTWGVYYDRADMLIDYMLDERGIYRD